MSDSQVIRQAAAIPIRRRSGRTEVALITSSDGKRWIVPKGGIERGETPSESARREALEEAGLRGRVSRRCVARIRYRKARGVCRIDFFLMRVTEVLESWHEDDVRRRRWVPLAEAQRRVDERLRGVLKDARASIRA